MRKDEDVQRKKEVGEPGDLATPALPLRIRVEGEQPLGI